ncbi:hypothetical protein [uncultured Neisseria sp.]|uniref:hypothetical protein n=1 Tax=uncultured Neisseria sp. TaxID=237778 RepID=UPI002610D187|nr:hypothetical protein [uncultured Neisseria sp.]
MPDDPPRSRFTVTTGRLKKIQTTLTQNGFLGNLIKDGKNKMKKEQMKNRFNRLTAVITAAALLMPAPASAWVDGAALAQRAVEFALTTAHRAQQVAQWTQQISQWEQELKNWVRGQMEKIPAVKKLMQANEKAQIEQMFAKREKRCAQLSSPASRNLCVNTVVLERTKYHTLLEMDNEITNAFAEINKTIAKQNDKAQGSESNTAGTYENEVIKKLQTLDVTIQRYRNRIQSLDAMIEQYKWARVNLSKDQLSGSGNGGKTLTQGTAALLLQKNIRKIKNDTEEARQKSSSISNSF